MTAPIKVRCPDGATASQLAHLLLDECPSAFSTYYVDSSDVNYVMSEAPRSTVESLARLIGLHGVRS